MNATEMSGTEKDKDDDLRSDSFLLKKMLK